jgi:predicted nucleic acid-binding protein
MKQSIFIDTDVVLDFLTGRQPFAMNAAVIFTLSVERKISTFISPLTFSNCYYVMRKVAKHEKIINKLTDLLEITDISSMNKQTIELALKSDFKDFEDALQNFSATHNDKIDVIITRNLKDYKHSKIAVMSPETFLKSLSAST